MAKLRNKDRKWLELCNGNAGMYPGIQCDVVPSSVSIRLQLAGLIDLYMPHNSAHKNRWHTTDAGRAALASIPDERGGVS